MGKITAKVISVYIGDDGELSKKPCDKLEAELDGFVGDRHRSYWRKTWDGDKQPEGTKRRNERQWSAVSVEELDEIQQKMDLREPLTGANLGANICLSGMPQLSCLPKGTTLEFPSGAVLMVEEYNPPCFDMAKKLATIYSTNSGQPLREDAFLKAALFNRGLVGVIDVPGIINSGDDVTIRPYAPPSWISKISENAE